MNWELFGNWDFLISKRLLLLTAEILGTHDFYLKAF